MVGYFAAPQGPAAKPSRAAWAAVSFTAVHRAQRRGDQLAVLPARVGEAVADQVHDAGLDRGLGEHRPDRLKKAFEAVDHRDQDVLHAAVTL